MGPAVGGVSLLLGMLNSLTFLAADSIPWATSNAVLNVSSSRTIIYAEFYWILNPIDNVVSQHRFEGIIEVAVFSDRMKF